jgi:hypothetical protein
MRKYYENLINNNCFNEQDAKEVADIIIKEENVTEPENYDFSRAYDDKGARWNEEEVVNYVNMESDEKLSLEDIMKWPNFYRLTSGLIVSWNY